MAFVEGFSLKRPFSLSRVGKIASRRGLENRGSLISVPLALRVFCTILFENMLLLVSLLAHSYKRPFSREIEILPLPEAPAARPVGAIAAVPKLAAESLAASSGARRDHPDFKNPEGLRHTN